MSNSPTPLDRLTMTLLCLLTAGSEATTNDRRRGLRRWAADDRGDVPGWVMVTMMTAIVVLVLLGVFQEAVVNAVRSAFESITGAGGGQP